MLSQNLTEHEQQQFERAEHERRVSRSEGALRCEETWAIVAGSVVWRWVELEEVLSCRREAEDEG